MSTLTAAVAEQISNEPFVLLDVGASGGIAPMWSAFGSNLRAFGFEPLLSECQRLNETSAPGIEFVPAFIVGPNMPEPDKFPWPQWWDNRWGERTSTDLALRILNQRMEALFNRGDTVEFSKQRITIDDFVQARGSAADFLKIDTDGTDFEVLRGAEKSLSPLLGVMIECEFHGSCNPRANTFTNIDIFLRSAGFTLVDLQSYRYSRGALPRRFIHDFPSGTEQGQIKWADAIYLRDGAFPGYCDLWNWRPSAEKLLKLVSLYELFGLVDCAAELLLAFSDLIGTRIEVPATLDILTPALDSERLSYRDYISAFMSNPERFYLRPKQSIPLPIEISSGPGIPEVDDPSPAVAIAKGDRVLNRILQKVVRRDRAATSVHNTFVSGAPRLQNALDIFKGEWTVAMPENSGLRAGNFPGDFFNDTRVLSAERAFGGFQGKKILELGPCEAHHTIMIAGRGAESITAIEANTRAYLKCLVMKEVFSLTNARFLLGNAVEFMKETSERFNILFASGFLYHQAEPDKALTAMARVSDQIFVQSHYFDAAAIAASNLSGRFGPGRKVNGVTYYPMQNRNRFAPDYLGGIAHATNWIGKDDMLRTISSLGFSVEIVTDEITPNGPSIWFVAIRNNKLAGDRSS